MYKLSEERPDARLFNDFAMIPQHAVYFTFFVMRGMTIRVSLALMDNRRKLPKL